MSEPVISVRTVRALVDAMGALLDELEAAPALRASSPQGEAAGVGNEPEPGAASNAERLNRAARALVEEFLSRNAPIVAALWTVGAVLDGETDPDKLGLTGGAAHRFRKALEG